MTTAPHPPHALPETAATPREAFRAVRDRGLRLSSARRALLVALIEAAAPLTAEEASARAGGADVASTYRNLEVLERLGLVQHLHVGHGSGRYRYAGGRALDYLACEECGVVLAVESGALDEVRDALRDAFGFEARFSHFPLSGRCADCATG